MYVQTKGGKVIPINDDQPDIPDALFLAVRPTESEIERVCANILLFNLSTNGKVMPEFQDCVAQTSVVAPDKTTMAHFTVAYGFDSKDLPGLVRQIPDKIVCDRILANSSGYAAIFAEDKVNPLHMTICAGKDPYVVAGKVQPSGTSSAASSSSSAAAASSAE